MMPDGPTMDVIIKRLGIDANTTVVFSLPKNSSLYDQSVPFWNFRYWGFARERLKILNGGDDAWDVAGLPLTKDKTDKYTPSTYSVSKNAALKDVVRYSLSEMIGKVDAILADPALKETWQMIDVRGFATTPYMTNALRLSSPTMYLTRLDSDATTTPPTLRNYVYPDKQTFETKIADLTNFPVRDGATNVVASATKKTICMCGSSISASPTFVLFDAVLNVPEGDIAMYDGSSSQWNNYNTARLTAAYPNTIATVAQRNAWSFNVYTSPVNPLAISKNRAQGAFPSTVTSALAGIWAIFSPVLGPTHVDMNQIENIDRAYIRPAAAPSTPTSTTPSGGSTSGGGC
jgi:3-mercaptopyruvate sulfurtransferase SseA